MPPTLTALELLLIRKLSAAAASVAMSSYSTTEDRNRLSLLADLVTQHFGSEPSAPVPAVTLELVSGGAA